MNFLIRDIILVGKKWIRCTLMILVVCGVMAFNLADGIDARAIVLIGMFFNAVIVLETNLYSEDKYSSFEFLLSCPIQPYRIVLSKFILEIATAIGTYTIIIGVNALLMLFGRSNPLFDLYSLIFNIGLILIHTSCAMIIFLKSGFSSIRYASIPLFAVVALSLYISRNSPVFVFSIYQVTVGTLGIIVIVLCFLYSVYLLKSRRYLQR